MKLRYLRIFSMGASLALSVALIGATALAQPPVEKNAPATAVEQKAEGTETSPPADIYHGLQRLENGNTIICVSWLNPPQKGGGPREKACAIVEVNPKGEIVYLFDQGLNFVHNADLLPNGNLLCSDTGNDRVIEMDRKGNIVWKYDDNIDYPNDANRLKNGNTLISVRDMDKIIEVSPEGKIVWQYTGAHHQHNPDRLANGNTVFADSEAQRIVEIDAQGNIVWSYDEGLNWPRDADRLENGNTLICDSRNNRIIEVSPDKKIVWSQKAGLPYDADRLPNGNTLFTDDSGLYDPGEGAVREVTPEGNEVFHFRMTYEDYLKRKETTGSEGKHSVK